MRYGTAFRQAIGSVVARVEASTRGESATIHMHGGATLRLVLDGDCCSSSYFTKEAQFADLVGAKILAFEEVDSSPDGFEEYDLDGTDSLSWHFLKVTTDKGHVTIDWRNDSNGYYDGTLSAEYDGPPHGPFGPREMLERGLIDADEAAVLSDLCAESGCGHLGLPSPVSP